MPKLSRFDQERKDKADRAIEHLYFLPREEQVHREAVEYLSKSCSCHGGLDSCPFDLNGNCEGVS